MKSRSCMPSSSTRRCSTPRRERRCSPISYTMSAAAPETGRWILRGESIKAIREKVGDGKVLLRAFRRRGFLSGGGLLSKAVGNQLTCVFVDHGLLRKNEGDEVEAVFGPTVPTI